MELTALCKKLLTAFLVLVVSQIQHNYAQDRSFAQIVPTGLQLFEYSSLSINCEGLNPETGWTVKRRRKGEVSACVSNWVTTTTSVCAIKPVYLTDSGEYWCEIGGERSNTVNITVTAGAVILESPVVPVKEGEVVTFICRSTMAPSAHIADFFKDDRHISSSSTGKMTITRVSESDEGLYKCNISEFGESPESWLAVRAFQRGTQNAQSYSQNSCHCYLVVRTIFTVIMVVLLLLIVGLLYRGNI
ncbi:low affinity immunoglobulin gamma Fc region receptor III-like [Simochromis diagramma]|uniref:low affinity immunoglobulin gamma Fc region receptor III-like n=1 Tax=Simochromis diagramma TaxID=43689 RepID=UPI001A7E97EF|nr:low affinity immunoglobulin gamma Fc region receptor III-like [Simochromis diagramma]